MPTFESRAELARHLFDRALEPDMTGTERLRLVFLVVSRTDDLWEQYAE